MKFSNLLEHRKSIFSQSLPFFSLFLLAPLFLTPQALSLNHDCKKVQMHLMKEKWRTKKCKVCARNIQKVVNIFCYIQTSVQLTQGRQAMARGQFSHSFLKKKKGRESNFGLFSPQLFFFVGERKESIFGQSPVAN